MRKLLMVIVVLALAGVGAWCEASDDDAFSVTLEDGSRITGVVKLENLDIETPYGTLTVPFADIMMIEFGRDGEEDKLLTARMPLIGRVALDELVVKSEVFGDVSLTRKAVVRLERSGGPHRLVGSWVGVASDKPGQGVSKDSIVLDLRMGATGQLEGVASGEFVGGRETKLENVRIRAGTLGFEVRHRTGVRFRIMLALKDEKLQGEGIEPGGGECELTLERQLPGASTPRGPGAGDGPDSPG